MGLLTGIISGCVVSLYYREKDKSEQFERLLHNNKQDLNTYINLVKFELGEIIKNPSQYTEDKSSEFRRFLSSPPRFESMSDLSKIPKCYHRSTKEVYDLISGLNHYLENNNLDKTILLKYERELFKAQYEMMRISTKEPSESKAL